MAWSNVFQFLKENNCQPRLPYLAKLSFIIEEEIKTFHDKKKTKIITIKPVLKTIKGILHTEEEDKHNHANMGKNKSHRK
jgi:hypothetical protein